MPARATAATSTVGQLPSWGLKTSPASAMTPMATRAAPLIRREAGSSAAPLRATAPIMAMAATAAV